jgi:hypothetical protein
VQLIHWNFPATNESATAPYLTIVLNGIRLRDDTTVSDYSAIVLCGENQGPLIPSTCKKNLLLEVDCTHALNVTSKSK